MEKIGLANRTNYTPIWYAFYDLQLGKRSGLYSYSLEPTQGENSGV